MDDLDNLRRITEHLRMMREELAEEVARPMAIDEQPKDYEEIISDPRN